jgi:hypothetical protein
VTGLREASAGDEANVASPDDAEFHVT